MVANQFEAILQDLEPYFKCKLTPDNNNSCLVKMGIGIQVQMELDPYGEDFVIGARLGVISSGRYREAVFREALKANNFYPPRQGIFSFSRKSGNLILFIAIPLRDVNRDKLIKILNPFIARAHIWSQAISRGAIPMGVEETASSSKSGLFGLFK